MNTNNTTAAVDTMTGKDFPRLCREDYDTAAAMVAAALTNAAKHIDNKENAPGVALAYRHANDEELTADTIYFAFDRSDNPKYCDIPLLLYIAKAAGTALRKAMHHAAKVQLTAAEMRKYFPAAEDGETAAPDAVIDGTAVQHTFPAPGDDLIREETESRILDGVSERIRPIAKQIIADLQSGYSVNAAAKRAGVSPRRALEIAAAVKAAAAVVIWEDGEFSRFERVILSDERTTAAVDKRKAAAHAATMTAAARERERKQREAAAAVKAAPGRLNAAAYMAFAAAYKPTPRIIKHRGNMWTDADARAAAAVRPPEVIREEYRRVK